MSYTCSINLHKNAAAKQLLERIISFTPKVDNTVMNFLPANQLVSAWAIEKTVSRDKAMEWLHSQVNSYPNNKIMQWALQVFNKQSGNLKDEDKDGEVRILEQL
jgi:hypothetical protein